MNNKYTEFGMNRNTYELLFKDVNKDVKLNKNIIKYTNAFFSIDNFTLGKCKLKKEREYKLKKDNMYCKIKKNNRVNEYECEYSTSKKMFFNKISEKLKPLFKEEIKELESTNRYEKCHFRSCMLATKLKESKVITGIGTIFDHEFLHSVVEAKKGNKDVILDWTRNLIMYESDYIKLLNFKIINETEGKYITWELKKIKEALNDISTDVFLTFNNELIHDIEKNKFLYKKKV